MAKKMPQNLRSAILRLLRTRKSAMTIAELMAYYGAGRVLMKNTITSMLLDGKLNRVKNDDGIWTYYDPDFYAPKVSSGFAVDHPSTWTRPATTTQTD
jgi:hypothetical protein